MRQPPRGATAAAPSAAKLYKTVYVSICPAERRGPVIGLLSLTPAAVAARVCFRSTHKAATNIPPSAISAADQLQRLCCGLAYVCDCELIGAVGRTRGELPGRAW
jgi:hypothetical protein